MRNFRISKTSIPAYIVQLYLEHKNVIVKNIMCLINEQSKIRNYIDIRHNTRKTISRLISLNWEKIVFYEYQGIISILYAYK